MKKLLLVGIFPLLLAGCRDSTTNATTKEAKSVDRQNQVYINSQPAPFFDWSLERHLMTDLYQARNNAVNTYTYVRNLQGQVIFSCPSIGFPIPSNTQLTNPESIDCPNCSSTRVALPQAEPNGLYTSPSTSGTYVFCVNPDGTVSPSYFEADVEAHTQKLNESGNTVVGDPTLKIKPSK